MIRLSSTWKSILPGLVLVFSLALALRGPIAAIPLERDEGEYAYIAQRWLLGEVPYQHSFDQKPPGVFAAYALIFCWLGTSPSAIHWGVQIYSLGTLTLILLLGRRLFSPLSGTLTAMLAALLITDPGMWANAANTELFMLLPLAGGFLAALLAARHSSFGLAFLTGVLAGAAMLFKQVALLDAVFFMLLLCTAARSRGWLVAAMFLGGASVLTCCFAYFHQAGAGQEFYDCVIGYNLKYASTLPLRDYLANLWDKLPRLLVTGWPIYLLSGVGLILGLSGRSKGPDDRRRRSTALVAGWLLFALLGVLPGGYFYPHYFLHLVPALALLGGAGSIALFEKLPATTWIKRGLACLLAAAAIAIGVLSAPWYYLHGTPETKCRCLYANNPFPESIEVGQFIAEHSSPDESIFVFGSEPQIYFYAKRKSASRYIFAYPLATAFSDTLGRQRAVMTELQRNQPAIIVYVLAPPSFAMRPEIVNQIPRYVFLGVADLLERSYEPIAAIPLVQTDGMMPLVTGKDLKDLLPPVAGLKLRSPPPPLVLTVWRHRPSRS
jgi:Dolichyl-phosphate-mannose-protein mannosyltransferase